MIMIISGMKVLVVLGNPENEWGYPTGIPYYFNTDSGRSYSEVDFFF